MSHLLVIGGASSDILHLESGTHPSAGGAGMYTSMAAHFSGTPVSLFAPCPNPVPDILQPVLQRLSAWLGPPFAPEELPHFEISYQNGKTEYIRALFGAESLLEPSMLPADLSAYDAVHVIPLGDARRQLAFITACRQRGARFLSAGTYLRSVQEMPQSIHEIMRQTDLFFMNQGEALSLFGSLEAAKTQPGKVLFITLDAQGACVVQGEHPTFIPPVPARELDPTGAGDTFCGATLARLVRGSHPVMAARHGVYLAACMIQQVGPAALLSHQTIPPLPLDARVQVNASQVARISKMLSGLEEASPFNFISPELPPAHHPRALEYFFAVTFQQFGFWSEKNGRYHQPLIAPLAGVQQKGAFYLFDAFCRRLKVDPDFFTPQRQAHLTRAELLDVLRADDGTDPMPAFDLHLDLARSYGRDMLALNLTPDLIVRQSLASPRPLQKFISILDRIAGYKEDPLRKKTNLLALILNQRPEFFLPFGAGEGVEPVIDYHLMRSNLRVGLIDVQDQELREKLIARQLLSPDQEWAVRFAAYRAIEQVVVQSGKNMGAVDWFFFGARKRCPEMTEPECGLCPLNAVCLRLTDLFQPVLRTTFY